MKKIILLSTFLLATTVSAGILKKPISFVPPPMATGMNLVSHFGQTMRKYVGNKRALVMLRTDGNYKDSYTAVIKDHRLIISAKSDGTDSGYLNFTYKTSLPDDINGDNIKLSFNEDILIVEM